MRKSYVVLFLALILLAVGWSYAQQPDIIVGKVDLPSLRWGNQKANIEMENTTDMVKFVVVETDISFSGSYLNPERKTISNLYLEPMTKKIVHPKFYVPSNYGKAEIKIRMYDVVDTLDEILPGQKFYEQPFFINFSVPEEMFPYSQEKITFPPRVEQHPYLDNEFIRYLLILLKKGKSVQEIADMSKSDLSFVIDELNILLKRRYVKKVDSAYVVTFPIVFVKEAEISRKLADKTSSELANIISNNMKHYWPTIDSMVQAGTVTKDSNDFISPSSFLYYPYPVVSALVLWFDLGQKFITRAAPLLIYDGTDVCNAANNQYMYAVQGGDVFNGTNFYALLYEPNSYRILFADKDPHIKCEENFHINNTLPGTKADWGYEPNQAPEFFVMDTAIARPALSILDKNTDTLLTNTYYALKNIAIKFGHKKLYYGHRYWFWNLVATQTLHKLITQGVIKRRGDGNFKFESLGGR